jgi:PAS domain S-box-containing protein
MRIKTQFLISIITFSIIVAIIGASVAVTQQQIAEFNNKEAIAHDVQTGASDLYYISNNYFLYQLDTSISLWQTKVSALSDKLSTLNSSNPQQQTLFQTVSGDIENLKIVFAGVTSFLSNAPRNVSIRVLPSFQTQWNRMAVQIQALSFDSQQLSQAIRDQANQVIQVNTILTFVLMTVFGAFFITIYLINYRGTLRSISKLKNGLEVLGSGNLDYVVEAGKNDEIEDVSKSVNQMAINLKTVTASKADLERAQTALRESEQRWATTLASIGDAVIATDTSGKVEFLNGEAEKLTGWLLSDAFGRSVKEVFNIVNEQTRLEVENPIVRVLREGIVVGLANHTILVRKDGTEVPIDDSGAPIKSKEGKIMGVVLIFRDITERKKAEEAIEQARVKLNDYATSLERLVEERTKQLKDSERMAAIGATAGMVGHDIRNPLQAITSDVYLAKSDLAPLEDSEGKKNALESLSEIENNVVYINKIVQDLQDFARPLNPVAKETNLRSLIEELVKKNSIPKQIKVGIRVQNEAEQIVADPEIVRRVLANLFNNAVQAMPDGGKLHIHAIKEANDTIITVQDTGVGIPEEVKPKLFTPLFTTKSKGQGFGLVVVKRMTEAMGGTVTFESELGKGTKFIIRLPPQRAKQ